MACALQLGKMVEQSKLAPLKDPIQAIDYLNIERLKLLLLSQDGEPPLIRLLDGRALLKYFAEGGVMKRRQDVEREHPEVFCSKQFMEKLLADFAIDLEHKNRPSWRQFYQFPGMVALSYAWIAGNMDPPHPDPNRKQVEMLQAVIEWWMSERANIIMWAGKENLLLRQSLVKPEDVPCDPSFGMFIDFMCMYQPPFGTGEQEAFGAALFNIGLLYGHCKTALWKVIATPTEDRVRQYDQRGWCLLEKTLADLLSIQHLCLDVSKFRDRESIFSYGREEFTASSAFGTAVGARKSTEELAAQADQQSLLGKGYLFPTLEVMMRAAKGPPVDDRGFKRLVTWAQFSQPADVDVCCGIYARAALPLLSEETTTLQFKSLAWSTHEWRLFGLALQRCNSLQSLEIESMLNGRDAEALFGFPGEGAVLPALSKLYMVGNPDFGEAGCAALARAVQRGAMPALMELDLRMCGARGALFEGLGEGALPALTKLCLLRNEAFWKEGCAALAGAVQRGAMPALKHLALVSSGVTGVLFENLGAGALPALTSLSLVDNEEFEDAGCVALARALQRGAMSALQNLNLERCLVTCTGRVALRRWVRQGGSLEVDAGCCSCFKVRSVGNSGRVGVEALTEAYQSTLTRRCRAFFRRCMIACRLFCGGD